VKVVAQGSLVDIDQAGAALAEGKADAVEMTRAQIAEPDLGLKLAAGEAPRPCILCNQTCQVRDVRNPIVTCVGEPRSGHELSDPDIRAAPGRPTRLLVVGGGPAGLECARVAALEGHSVRLVERRAQLGGMLRIAARGAGRGRLAALVDWLEAECRRLGVEMVRGVSIGPDELEAHDGPVVLATGSRTGERAYRVAPDARWCSAADLLEVIDADPGTPGVVELPPPGEAMAVWDPIGGPIAVSVAELLQASGRQVSLITPDLIPGNELSRSGDLAPANVRLQSAGVVIERRSILRAANLGEVVVEDRFTGEERRLPAAAIVDAGYRLPEDDLWRRSGRRFPRVGDAVAPRTVHESVLEGRRAALALSASVARVAGLR
jgi:2,4-dienoyl-CoA reductase (NADPH2)